jgi:hypothetical protein
MKLKVETSISKETIFQANNSKVFNQLFASSDSDEFKASALDIKEVSLTQAENGTYEFKLSDLVSDFSKVSSLTVFCNSLPADTKQPIRPVKFTTAINTASIISSQFSVYNIEDMTLDDIICNTFTVAAEENAVFTIIISYK